MTDTELLDLIEKLAIRLVRRVSSDSEGFEWVAFNSIKTSAGKDLRLVLKEFA